MYFNNVHIIIYVILGLIGIFVGKFVSWMNLRLPNNQKVISKDFFHTEKKNIKNQYLIMSIISLLYIGLLYYFGINKNWFENIELLKYLILTPMLVSIIFIDGKHRIIPNRLNLTMFEIGIVLAFIVGVYNFNMAKDMFLGMIVGGGIFLVITILGSIFYGKEAMGLGDVKLMGALGLYFGVNTIIAISVLSFFIGAFASIIILIARNIKNNKDDPYIPFGPFIVIATFIAMFVPESILFNIFLMFCQKISDKILEIIGG